MTAKPTGRGRMHVEAITVPLVPIHSDRALAEAVDAARHETRVHVVREILAVAEGSAGGDVRGFLRRWIKTWERAEAEKKEPSR